MTGSREDRQAAPTVSVVLPTWNRMEYLPEAIRSVLGQTFEDLELIVVDDGSTDGSRAYLDTVVDPRLHRVDLPRTGSVASVRNAGAAVARGRYLCFLDSDDVWLPDKLAVQIAAMERGRAAWSYTRYSYMDGGGASIAPRAGRWRPLSGRIALEILTHEASVSLITVLMERRTFNDLGGFDRTPGIREDYELLVRLAVRADALAIPESLARVRVHPGRTTRSWQRAESFAVSAGTYDVLLGSLEDGDLRSAARRQRAEFLAEAAGAQLSAGAGRAAARSFLAAARAGAPPRRLVSALRRGIGIDRALFRRILRPLVGRETRTWLVLRSPRLRLRCFADLVDCVIYSLLLSDRDVRFVQIGSNDGVTNDPLWTFRRYPNWSGVLVEPVPHVFERLARNYAPWRHRFALERAAVADSGGVRMFHYLPETTDAPSGYHQGGSLDPACVRAHARALGLTVEIASEAVRCFTYPELCDRHGLDAPDLVHVDAEGMDAEIVRRIDLARTPPAVLLYEHVHLAREARGALRERLDRAGYAAIEVGDDTLAVRRAALDDRPPLRTAWRLALRSRTPESPGTSS